MRGAFLFKIAGQLSVRARRDLVVARNYVLQNYVAEEEQEEKNERTRGEITFPRFPVIRVAYFLSRSPGHVKMIARRVGGQKDACCKSCKFADYVTLGTTR